MKAIIFISPGPTYNAHLPSFKRKFEMLSQSFVGFIWTTSPTNEQFSIMNFKYQSVDSEHRILDHIKYFLTCVKWAYEIRRQDNARVDLITTYDPLKTGIIGVFASKVLKAKLAVEVNGVYTSPFEWIDNSRSLSTKMKRVLYPLIMKWVLKRAHGIKLLFKDQIRPLNLDVRDKVIRVFPNFIATSAFSNCQFPERKEVLFVGFPFKRKGVDILIDAFKQVAPKYPNWKLKILGWFQDPTELYEAIDGHPQIYHHRPVHHKEMPEHIGKCAILVLPSRSEAMGRVLVEAMVAGKPRIGSNVDGIPTVINDGVDGLLVEPEDVDDLARKLDLLMGDKELREKLGKAAAKRAKEEFTEDIYIRNVIKFYNEVMGG